MKKTPHLIILIIPGILFFLVLVVLLLRSPSPQPSSTTAKITPSPTSTSSPSVTPSPDVSQLQGLVDQITGFKITNPQLVPPAFDRTISLPAE